ncbi:cytochrome ubiquinol oxidase subunit I [Kibdelosporangium phytohabitans]|uniref:Cytochrome BD oxidase subunit I n=1 Tax=Kibdelosporangium phytohabitans TaxID=860235 RepID=A0A0N9HYY2_9PSEU|nr:cytochrome ubiquinol oxidase subunit I [Kibdelosporangium phytohabitans]ALG08548.1 cytochrome BD oxidase subunit I [Kibdelosporangium phytohabitans]MBE1470376.1 cytochrome d ubiquinol oxidase subunit I [Kibdelosporangium phytohabitans]
MDVVDLARLQFAGTTSIHWLFVILTLGLVPLVAVTHTAAVLSRDQARKAVLLKATRFWGQLYVVNYALGIVTGLVMEFQFGLGWSGLGKFAGNVIGAPIALETLVAFFAESTFLGMWIFGWGRLRPAVHATLIWLVALTAYASAYFILVANGFMQHPVGYGARDGTAYLTDLAAVMTNPSALLALTHITAAALMTGAMFVAGVSAYRFLKGDREFFQGWLRWGTVAAAVLSIAVYEVGALQYPLLGTTQPAKLAALESNGVVAQAHDIMLYIGYSINTITVLAAILVFFKRMVRWIAWSAIVTVPLPFVASLGGWLFREIGRQPWIVYGELTVDQAVSHVSAATMWTSLVAFLAVLVALAVANWWLIARFVRRGPDGVHIGREEQLS